MPHFEDKGFWNMEVACRRESDEGTNYCYLQFVE